MPGLPRPDLARLPLTRLPRSRRDLTSFLPGGSPDHAPTDRRVLVTGGASGLGLALARAFLDRGDRVVVADLAPEDERPGSVPSDAGYLRLDVRSEDDWRAARERLDRMWGGLDVLVNNAGIAQGGRIDLLTEDDWSRILDVNVHGVARGCRTFAPVFTAQRSGLIVNTASLAGLAHPPAMSSYCASKAAVVALSESLRWELEPYGVSVAVVCPAFLRTNLASSLNSSDPLAAKMATGLITKAARGADEVATAVLAGLDRGEFLVLPDRDARITYPAKRFGKPLYERAMRKMARRLADEGGADGR